MDSQLIILWMWSIGINGYVWYICSLWNAQQFNGHETKWTINSCERLSRLARYDHKTTWILLLFATFVMYTHFSLFVCFNEPNKWKLTARLGGRLCKIACICIHSYHLFENIPCHGSVPAHLRSVVFVDFLLLLLLPFWC